MSLSSTGGIVVELRRLLGVYLGGERFPETAEGRPRYAVVLGTQEGHVARGDEDERVMGRREPRLHPGEGSLAGAAVGDGADAGRGRLSAGQDHLLAAGRERAGDTFDEGCAADLQEQLVAAHPAAPPAGQDHAGGRGAQVAVPAAASPLSLPTLLLRARTLSRRMAVSARRARRLETARSTAAPWTLRARDHVAKRPLKIRPR